MEMDKDQETFTSSSSLHVFPV